MTVIVDTSVLIDYLRGREEALDALRSARDEHGVLTASVLTKTEILAGTRPAERQATCAMLATLDWVEVDEDLAERAGALANQFLRSHRGIEVVDYVIAATVQRAGAQLMTTNVKHFPMFASLEPPYPAPSR